MMGPSNKLAGRGWSELAGLLIGGLGITIDVLDDAMKSALNDPVLCACYGDYHCDEPILPPGLDLVLAVLGILVTLLVFAAMGLKLW